MRDHDPAPSSGSDAELLRFRRASGALAAQLERAVERLEAEARSAEAGIWRAHVAISNPEFRRLVHEPVVCSDTSRRRPDPA